MATRAKEVVPALRVVLVPFVVLAVAAFGSLYLRSADTERFFAWTIEPPLTAALLGAAYGGTLVFFLLALRERRWADVRLAVYAPLALSTALLVATLLHLDRFHLDRGGVPGVVAWIWLVVYVVVPPALVAVLVLQAGAPGGEPDGDDPLPAPLRLGLWVLGGVSLVGGAVLFTVPGRLAPHWPWAITPLTGRALAGWLLGLGVAAVVAARARQVRQLRSATAAVGAIGALGLIALLLHREDLDGGWGIVATTAYLVALVVAGVTGSVLDRGRDRATGA